MMRTSEFISALVKASQKAGNIARICREDEEMLSLLVQEKNDDEKNPRFITDFKTLADVLVQEIVSHDLCSQFPTLKGHIYGEEDNHFTSNGETITINFISTLSETADLLFKIIGNAKVCKSLAEALYSPVMDENISINDDKLPLLPENIGIWIDPIDSTGEYIRGGSKVENGIIISGLPCVTVLLGVFDRDSGLPIVGVVNQPFYENESNGWKGRYFFGINYNDFKLSQPIFTLLNREVIAVSSSEDIEIKRLLEEAGYEIVEISGAGFKLLNVIMGTVCAYVLSKPTSFLWDICACDAILSANDGGIIDYTKLAPIKYQGKEELSTCCNSGGIIAYRNTIIKNNIIEILKLKNGENIPPA